MRKLFSVTAIASILVLSGTIVAGAATSAAQITGCTATTWCFSPNPIVVNAGSSVDWTNSTGATHTASSNSGGWTTGNIVAGATSAPVTFNAPGTFAYHCAIHPFMTGTVVVNAVTASTTPTPAPVVVKRLAQGGGGPGLPLAALLVLLGLALLR
ncbi:MAG TPA: plastocyanin/azurin family copper-binding protein, partial [Candidatus Dormibacteraeota bacterium]|nr:plastocyanin/azurin family copper-binding protein [Candidatus Dormibacteraeota bacterium]